MEKGRIKQRIDLVGVSTGSIVSTATWCALNTSAADSIISYICQRMRAADTNEVTRASLLYVCHELLLTCVARGTSETGRRAVMLALSKHIPHTVCEIFDQRQRQAQQGQREELLFCADGTDAFARALSKVIAWWTCLDVFPSLLLNEMRACMQRAHEAIQQLYGSSCGARAVASAHHTSCALPAVLQNWEMLLSRYRDAKALWKHGRGVKRERSRANVNDVNYAGNSSIGCAITEKNNAGLKRVKNEREVDEAEVQHEAVDLKNRDMALHALSLLQDSLRAYFVNGSSQNDTPTMMMDWCEAEKVELLDHGSTVSLSTSSIRPTSVSSWSESAAPAERVTAVSTDKPSMTSLSNDAREQVTDRHVKVEGSTASTADDDVLASFY